MEYVNQAHRLIKVTFLAVISSLAGLPAYKKSKICYGIQNGNIGLFGSHFMFGQKQYIGFVLALRRTSEVNVKRKNLPYIGGLEELIDFLELT